MDGWMENMHGHNSGFLKEKVLGYSFNRGNKDLVVFEHAPLLARKGEKLNNTDTPSSMKL